MSGRDAFSVTVILTFSFANVDLDTTEEHKRFGRKPVALVRSYVISLGDHVAAD